MGGSALTAYGKEETAALSTRRKFKRMGELLWQRKTRNARTRRAVVRPAATANIAAPNVRPWKKRQTSIVCATTLAAKAELRNPFATAQFPRDLLQWVCGDQQSAGRQ
jgi:hypothetical protein